MPFWCVLVGFLWVRVNSGGFWCSYGAVMVRSGGVLVGSGKFWWVLVDSGEFWCSSGVFWCFFWVLVSSGGFW